MPVADTAAPLNMLGLFLQADIVVKVVMVLLPGAVPQRNGGDPHRDGGEIAKEGDVEGADLYIPLHPGPELGFGFFKDSCFMQLYIDGHANPGK